MIKSRKNKIQRQLINYIRSKYAMVTVEPEQGLFNLKCFYNAVEFASRDETEGTTVFECIYIPKNGGSPILHYINRKDGKYLEVTLGYQALQYEYYVLKEIHKDDYYSIGHEFDRSAEFWTNRFTNWFDRKILGITNIV